MEETIFESMERTRFVDNLLLLLMLVTPTLVLAAMRLLRDNPVVARHRPELLICALAAPVLWLLWHIYNAVADHYGIDSVFGIIVNAVIIFSAAAALTAFYLGVLTRHSHGEAPPPDDPEENAAENESQNLDSPKA